MLKPPHIDTSALAFASSAGSAAAPHSPTRKVHVVTQKIIGATEDGVPVKATPVETMHISPYGYEHDGTQYRKSVPENSDGFHDIEVSVPGHAHTYYFQMRHYGRCTYGFSSPLPELLEARPLTTDSVEPHSEISDYFCYKLNPHDRTDKNVVHLRKVQVNFCKYEITDGVGRNFIMESRTMWFRAISKKRHDPAPPSTIDLYSYEEFMAKTKPVTPARAYVPAVQFSAASPASARRSAMEWSTAPLGAGTAPARRSLMEELPPSPSAFITAHGGAGTASHSRPNGSPATPRLARLVAISSDESDVDGRHSAVDAGRASALRLASLASDPGSARATPAVLWPPTNLLHTSSSVDIDMSSAESPALDRPSASDAAPRRRRSFMSCLLPWSSSLGGTAAIPPASLNSTPFSPRIPHDASAGTGLVAPFSSALAEPRHDGVLPLARQRSGSN